MKPKHTRNRYRETSVRTASAGSTAAEMEQNSVLSVALRYAILPALVLTALAFITIRPLPDPDVWFHMALGREIVENGTFPRGDIFSYTAPGGEWISSGWGASVLLYLAHRAAGVPGLLWQTFAIAAVTHLLIYFTAIRRFRNSGLIAAIQLLAILTAYLRYTPRPDLWSQFFTATVLLVLVTHADSRGDGRIRGGGQNGAGRLWLLPVLFVLWANLHAGFLIGLLAVGVYGAWCLSHYMTTRSRADLVPLIPCSLCAVVWMLNPYGPRLLALAGKIESIPHVKEKIYEWMPLWASGPIALPWPSYAGIGLLFIVTLVAAIAVPVQGRRHQSAWWRPVLMLLFAGLAVYHRRHAGLAAVALPVLLLPDLARLEAHLVSTWNVARLRALAPSLALAGVVFIGTMQWNGKLGVGSGLLKTALNGAILPVFATEWLRANPPPGNAYNTYGAGAYLLYHLNPDLKVFIDGRLDVYDHRTWLDYLAIEDGTMPLRKAVEQYDITTCILYTKDARDNPGHLIFRLADSPRWQLVFFDDSYSVFVRETPATADYVDRHAFKYANPFAPDVFRKGIENKHRRVAAMAELSRIQQLPGQGGAWTGAMAAMAAHRMGDRSAVEHLLATAAARDPQNPLLGMAWEEIKRSN